MQSVDDPRGRLFEHFVRLASALRPRLILFENVRGLVTARGPRGEPGEVLRMVKAAFEGIGYGTSFALLNAADYGIPQRRVRCFLVASRCTALPEFPQPTHAEMPQANLFGSRLPWVTLGQFLASFPAPSAEEIVRPTSTLAFVSAIEYTRREQRRNGRSRIEVRQRFQQGEGNRHSLKGLGNALDRWTCQQWPAFIAPAGPDRLLWPDSP